MSFVVDGVETWVTIRGIWDDRFNTTCFITARWSFKSGVKPGGMGKWCVRRFFLMEGSQSGDGITHLLKKATVQERHD